MRLRSLTLSIVALLASAPAGLMLGAGAAEGPMKQSFGKTTDGQAVDRYTLKNANGMEADIITRGAVVTRLLVPGRSGAPGDVVLGFDTLEGYLKENPYFGAIVGRYGNRIAKGRFTLNGKTYTLATNNGPNALHGGLKGFDKQLWTARPVTSPDGQAVELTYVSKDGEEGYPGTLDGQGDLHAHERQRAADSVRHHDGPGHGGERHQPLVLQPGGAGHRRHPLARDHDQRRPVHARRQHADPHRRTASRSRAARSISASR